MNTNKKIACLFKYVVCLQKFKRAFGKQCLHDSTVVILCDVRERKLGEMKSALKKRLRYCSCLLKGHKVYLSPTDTTLEFTLGKEK